MAADLKEYIGDGIYVAFDGFALTLTTENGIEVTNTVVLKPREWAALERYVEALKPTQTATELGLAAIKALHEEEARARTIGQPQAGYVVEGLRVAPPCTNPSCVDGLAPQKTGPDDGDVDMEPCPVCGGPRA